MTVNNVSGVTQNSTAELESQVKALEAQKTKLFEEADEAGNATSSQEIEQKIQQLEAKQKSNLARMEKLENKITELKEEAVKNIVQAAKLQEEAVEKQEEKSKEVLDKCLDDYIEANKEGGKGMTQAQLSTNIQKAMPEANLGKALAKYTLASQELGQIDGLLNDLNYLIIDTESIGGEIKECNVALEAAKEAEAAAAAKRCDPMGFTAGQGNSIKYDFIVDDGKFDSASDFLGADNQWASMVALDKDGDGTVTSDEFKNGNVKMVKTDASGNQSIVDIAEEFGSDFSVNLNTYKEGGSHSAVDTTADFDNDGVIDQTMLGTFKININGQEIEGYNTLDDVDFLNKEYNLNGTDGEISEQLAPHINFFIQMQEEVQELDNELTLGMSRLGVSETRIQQIKSATQQEGRIEANEFITQLKKEQEAEEAEEAKKEAEEAEEAKKEAEEAEEAKKEVEEAEEEKKEAEEEK